MIKITNDTSTLNGALQELGETMATNLVSMGVTNASASDGLTTLCGKILNIAPSVGGITPTVSIDIDKTPSIVYVGNNVLISAKVNADYDDTSSVDIDLKGVLQGATVTFKNNGTTLGTGITGSDGIATYTISNIASGSYSITAHFDGTGTDYESATSSALTFTPSALIFYDSGVTGTANTNYTKTHSGVTASVSSTGTNISCSNYADNYYIANATLSGDFQIEYNLVQKTNDSGGFALLYTNSTNRYAYVEFVNDSTVDMPNGSTHWSYSNYTSNSVVKVTRVGSTLSLYLDGNLLGTTTVSTNDCRFGWKTHGSGGRNFTFKDLTIKSLSLSLKSLVMTAQVQLD